jgi:adenine-specific DNA-methyltransferase
MSLALPYMGTKRYLAPIVAEVICRAKPGVVLDVFSGMCAIGQAIGARRNIWNNDVQCFSSEVASALFTAKKPFSWTEPERDYITKQFRKNAISLMARYGKRLEEEKGALHAGGLARIRKYLSSARHVANDEVLENERGLRSRSKRKAPYNLCSITYADGYFGLLQSIEIDSARYALDNAYTQGVINDDQFRWLLIALCQAAGRIASTTGHFAQFLSANANNKGSGQRGERPR